MTCPECESEDIETRRFDEMVHNRGKSAIVTAVPVNMCRGCGFSFYDGATSKRLNDIAKGIGTIGRVVNIPVEAF